MYVEINSKFYEKNKEKQLKHAKETIDADIEGPIWTDAEMVDKIDTLDIDEDGHITIVITNTLGYFCFDLPLGTEELISLFEVAVKKMNKIKTMLEALK